MALISIIVPIFNAEQTLRKCIDSICAQTFSNIEIILINDGSTDRSVSICEEYCITDNRIQLLSQQNKGPAAARNKGIDHATSRYISFVDADDYIEIDMIEQLYNAAEESMADMVICGFFHESKTQMVEHEFYYKPGVYTDIECKKFAMDIVDDMSNERIPPYSWLRLIRRDAIENPQLRYLDGIVRSEDYLFLTQLHFRINRVCMLTDKPLYHYVNNKSSITNTYVKNYWKMARRIYDVLIDTLPLDDQVQMKLDKMLIMRSLTSLNNATRCSNRHEYQSEMTSILMDEKLKKAIASTSSFGLPRKLAIYIILMKYKLTVLIQLRYNIMFLRR